MQIDTDIGEIELKMSCIYKNDLIYNTQSKFTLT